MQNNKTFRKLIPYAFYFIELLTDIIRKYVESFVDLVWERDVSSLIPVAFP